MARKIGNSQLGLFAASSYLKRRPAPKTIAQLSSHDVVIFRGRQGKGRLKLSSAKGDEEVDVHGVVSTDDMATTRGLIAAGLGIGLLPIFLEKCASHGTLERVLPEYAMKGGGVHLVMPSARYVPTRVRLLSDFLAENFTLEACERALDPKRKKPPE